jgi:hypothetical protein
MRAAVPATAAGEHPGKKRFPSLLANVFGNSSESGLVLLGKMIILGT